MNEQNQEIEDTNFQKKGRYTLIRDSEDPEQYSDEDLEAIGVASELWLSENDESGLPEQDLIEYASTQGITNEVQDYKMSLERGLNFQEVYESLEEDTNNRATTVTRLLERHKGTMKALKNIPSRVVQIGLININGNNNTLLDFSRSASNSATEPDKNTYDSSKNSEGENQSSMSRRGLLGLIGLGGLGGLYALDRSEAEWQSSYEKLVEEELDSIADQMAVSEYQELNALGNGLREALDDYERVGLGFNPEYADIGVRGNSFEEYSLQQRLELEDSYEWAKNNT